MVARFSSKRVEARYTGMFEQETAALAKSLTRLTKKELQKKMIEASGMLQAIARMAAEFHTALVAYMGPKKNEKE